MPRTTTSLPASCSSRASASAVTSSYGADPTRPSIRNTDHIAYRIVAFSSRMRDALVWAPVMPSTRAGLCCRSPRRLSG